MRTSQVFYLGTNQYRFFKWNETHDQEDALEFEDLSVALDFVKCLMGDPYETGKLQSLAVRHAYTAALSGEDDISFLEQLAKDLVHKRMLVFREDRVYFAGFEEKKEKEKTEKPKDAPPPSTKKVKKTDWIEVQLLYKDGKPAKGQKYKITLPDGKVEEGELDGKGSAKFEEIEPGTAWVNFPELVKPE